MESIAIIPALIKLNRTVHMPNANRPNGPGLAVLSCIVTIRASVISLIIFYVTFMLFGLILKVCHTVLPGYIMASIISTALSEKTVSLIFAFTSTTDRKSVV